MQGATHTSRRDYRESEPDRMSALLTELAGNSAALVRDEIDLARQELREKAREMKSGVVAVGIGVTIASITLLLLSAAAVIALGNIIGYALSALVIGVVLGLTGGSTTVWGIRRIRQTGLKPEQTIETLQEDGQWLKRLR